MKQTMFVSFSGGRTSAYMCHWLLENKSDEYDFIFIFANTGLEDERTLKFVDQCDKNMGLNLVWVEAVINPEKGEGTRHRVVNYETAQRGGEMFEALCAKYGIPNAANGMHCTRELKLSAMQDYKKSIGYKKKHLTAVGIRSDEADRMSDDFVENGLTYPLIKWANHATKEWIIHWWGEQSFDLKVPEHYGNCVTCWKKSFRKLAQVARDDVGAFDVFKKCESLYGKIKYNGEDYRNHHGQHVFYRKDNSVDDVIKMVDMLPAFEDHKPELQNDLFSDWNITNGCDDSCEVY